MVAVEKCIENPKALQVRLKKVIGQLNGICGMIEGGTPCEDIILQMTAVNGALHKVSLMVLEAHLRNCVREGVESGNADETAETFAKALENFSKMA